MKNELIIRGIRMFPVESSAVKSVGYGEGSLLIQYVSGCVYEYKDVPSDVFLRLINTDSIGHFVNVNVKQFNYDYICDR